MTRLPECTAAGVRGKVCGVARNTWPTVLRRNARKRTKDALPEDVARLGGRDNARKTQQCRRIQGGPVMVPVVPGR